jgi:hypothetical protein
MAMMYPKNIAEYMPTDSERIVYQELKNQLPDTFDVFYSVKWTSYENGKLEKSEADFVVANPDYGFLCLEVKGGNSVRIEDNIWYVGDEIHGERKLKASPYDQAEKNMYYFSKIFSNKYNMKYQGIFGAGAVFPFYPVDDEVEINNRHRACTIDCNDLNNVYYKIKKMFRLWGGSAYGRRFYPRSQHEAFLELIRERIAISAAAGALVKYKEQQLSVINRVQDNYIYFLKNVRQFFIRGGAGTGKTWIAMKMAMNEALDPSKHVLFLCTSTKLVNMVRGQMGGTVQVSDAKSLFSSVIDNFEKYQGPYYHGLSNGLKQDSQTYDAIFVDEAQDFTEEWAYIVRKLLSNACDSRLGVFYDDVQVLRNESFGNGFGIDALPFLLHENIRNTANIYKWTAEKTNLGTDMIANPVEGPTPLTEYTTETGQLTLYLETLFRKYLQDEYLSNNSMALLTDDVESLLANYPDGIAKWKLVSGDPTAENEVGVFSVEEFKGLEADMIVYIHDQFSSHNMNYIAYTRAKYYLIELVRKY